jgi:hypothetical protein
VRKGPFSKREAGLTYQDLIASLTVSKIMMIAKEMTMPVNKATAGI